MHSEDSLARELVVTTRMQEESDRRGTRIVDADSIGCKEELKRQLTALLNVVDSSDAISPSPSLWSAWRNFKAQTLEGVVQSEGFGR